MSASASKGALLDPAWALRSEPARIPSFVEEVVRLESPFRAHYRVVRRPIELGGVALAPGDRLFLLWASANRDEARVRLAELHLRVTA